MTSNTLSTFINEVNQLRGDVTSIYYTATDDLNKNRNLLKSIQTELSDSSLVEQFTDMVGEYKVNELRESSIAFFLTPERSMAYQISKLPIESFIFTGEVPFTLPLVQLDQTMPEGILVSLSYDQVKVYHVSSNGLSPLPIDEKDLTITSALGDQYRIGETNLRSAGNMNISVHGHNTTKEKKKTDQGRFYRVIDNDIAECLQNDLSDLPIILAGST